MIGENEYKNIMNLLPREMKTFPGKTVIEIKKTCLGWYRIICS